MPPKLSPQGFQALTQSVRLNTARRCIFKAASRPDHSSNRCFATLPSLGSQFPTQRWQETPEAMKAPFSLRNTSHDTPQKHYYVNEDPRRLDEFYCNFLGEGGDKVLPEETKWLAVTHKTFDQGRRGYNERLTFLGKRIVDLQTTLTLLNSESSSSPKIWIEEYIREPFQHPSLELLENLSPALRSRLMDKKRMAKLANSYGLLIVLRWRPRNVQNLAASGVESILAGTMYAIIGAIALQRGGEVATRIVRERILVPLCSKWI